MRERYSLSLAGLEYGGAWGAGPREAITVAAQMRFGAVQFDAAFAGTRPRDLDRSARRELAALLRRHGLAFTGVDLWIPPAHFEAGPHTERAADAVRMALELSADIAALVPGNPRPVVGVTLPRESPARVLLGQAALRVGVTIADHAWPAGPAAPGIGVGIDPAAVILSGDDPVRAVASLTTAPASCRLCDLGQQGRVAVGAGRLDVIAFEASARTAGYDAPFIADVRGLRDQIGAARTIVGSGS